MEGRITADLIVAHCLFGWILVLVSQKSFNGDTNPVLKGKWGNTQHFWVWGTKNRGRLASLWLYRDRSVQGWWFTFPLGGSQATCANFWSLWVIFLVYSLRVNCKKKKKLKSNNQVCNLFVLSDVRWAYAYFKWHWGSHSFGNIPDVYASV